MQTPNLQDTTTTLSDVLYTLNEPFSVRFAP